jgi:protein-tyrosine-phosphatase
MKEIGVDISGQRSKSLDEFSGQDLDLAVTLAIDASLKYFYSDIV